MTDVLLVAYHFPPIVSGGTERAVSLAEHLPSHGYRPHILTTDAFGEADCGSVYRAGEIVGLYRRLFNSGADTLPVAERSRQRTGFSMSPVARSLGRLLIPDGQVGWLPTAYRCARHILNTHPVRLILTTGPPFSSHLLGFALHRATHLPWIADFRDSWTYDPLDLGQSSSWWRAGIEAAMERLVLDRATRVTAVTDISAGALRERGTDVRVSVVPNGYTSSLGDLDPRTDSDGTFRFVHTGSFSASHPERNPEALVEAAIEVGDASFEIVFVGYLTDDERAIVQPLVDSGRAVLTGAVSREVAIAWQQKADALVVVDHPRDVIASNIPGKVYEYGATGKPMLAVVPRGATSELIRRMDAGLCVPHQPEAVAEAMRRLIDGDAGIEPDPGRWAPFERRKSVERMAGVFREVLG